MSVDGFGFIVNGIASGATYYSYVSSAGDMNGDGIDDILIGAKEANPNGKSGAGETYVVFGKDTAHDGMFDVGLDPSSVDGTNGFVLKGIDRGDQAGAAVSSAGDVDGDGVDDILIAALYEIVDEQRLPGDTYVVYGSTLNEMDQADGTVDGSINCRFWTWI
ncbi:MAG: hypothetical protein OIF47_11035 [Marinibacterium sp.]|nr:hypothetical protein [Marinibacterium sp.]